MTSSSPKQLHMSPSSLYLTFTLFLSTHNCLHIFFLFIFLWFFVCLTIFLVVILFPFLLMFLVSIFSIDLCLEFDCQDDQDLSHFSLGEGLFIFLTFSPKMISSVYFTENILLRHDLADSITVPNKGCIF